MSKVIKSKNKVFLSKDLTPETLESALWDTLKGIRSKKVDVKSANTVIAAAKELCNLSRLRLQYKILEGQEVLSRAIASEDSNPNE